MIVSHSSREVSADSGGEERENEMRESADELIGEEEAQLASKFEGYESYVDLATSHVHASLVDAIGTMMAAEDATIAAIELEVETESDSFLGYLKDFLLGNIALTKENSADLLHRAERMKDRCTDAVRRLDGQRRTEAELVHTALIDKVTQSFDAELEAHQGRMTQRFLDYRQLLGDRLIDMRASRVGFRQLTIFFQPASSLINTCC